MLDSTTTSYLVVFIGRDGANALTQCIELYFILTDIIYSLPTNKELVFNFEVLVGQLIINTILLF